MDFKSYLLNFRGYWRLENANGIPNFSGVYCVYNCVNNPQNNTLTINRLLYIGESNNVRDRIKSHEKMSEWNLQCSYGEELCFNFAQTNISESSDDRYRIEQALIARHKPLCNTVNSFSYPLTQVQTMGENFLLQSLFTEPS